MKRCQNGQFLCSVVVALYLLAFDTCLFFIHFFILIKSKGVFSLLKPNGNRFRIWQFYAIIYDSLTGFTKPSKPT